jgi:hypothetical protein
LELNSWHQVWDTAYEHLTRNPGALETLVKDPLHHHEIIASFTFTNQQIALAPDADEEDEDEEETRASVVYPRWETEKIGEMAGHNLYVNRNLSNYHWQLLDGARFEVPFRLGLLESLMERYPNGTLAYCLDVAQEFCDRVLPRAHA